VNLTPAQLRIVGSLIEKEMATPDAYPLTMNALLASCNQSSNRTPVVRFDEATVSNTLENLKAMGVVRVVHSRSNRGEKYRQVLGEVVDAGPGELALLCVMMLRGPQTASELRVRTERLHPFDGPDAVEDALRTLTGREQPLVVCLERQAGQREARWAHLLAGQPMIEPLPGVRSDVAARMSQSDRIAALEAGMQELHQRLDALRADHDAVLARLDVPPAI